MNKLTTTLIAAANYAEQVRECSAPQLRTVCADLGIEKISRTTKPELVKLATKAVGIWQTEHAPKKAAPKKAVRNPKKAVRKVTQKTGTLPSDRKIYNAVQKLTPADRNALATELDVETQKGSKARYVREIVRDLAKAIIAGGKVPAVVAEHVTTTRARKTKGEPAPKRIDSIVRILSSKKGVTLDQAAEQLVVDFPLATGGAKATAEAYRVLVRRAIARLRKGSLYAIAKELHGAGKTVVEEEGRYRIAAV